MKKELRKAIMDRSRLWNEYLKYPSRENFVNMNNILLYKISKEEQKRGFLQVNNFGILLNRF